MKPINKSINPSQINEDYAKPLDHMLQENIISPVQKGRDVDGSCKWLAQIAGPIYQYNKIKDRSVFTLTTTKTLEVLQYHIKFETSFYMKFKY